MNLENTTLRGGGKTDYFGPGHNEEMVGISKETVRVGAGRDLIYLCPESPHRSLAHSPYPRLPTVGNGYQEREDMFLQYKSCRAVVNDRAGPQSRQSQRAQKDGASRNRPSRGFDGRGVGWGVRAK